MKKSRRIIIIAAVASFFLAAAAGWIFYTPPLLESRRYNLPGFLYDFFAHAYYSTRADWLKNSGREDAARRAAARAAWHRPSRMEDSPEMNPEDLFGRGREYAGLSLDREAAALFRAALPGALPDEERSLEVISYLAMLNDWTGTGEAAAQLLAAHPESAEGRYWRGRALLELGQPEKAAADLLRAYQLRPALTDALYRIGITDELSGRKEAARSRYEAVVFRLPDHLAAWTALARLYEESGEKEKLKEAETRRRELVPPATLERKIGRRAILRGYRMLKEAKTGGPLDLELYLEGRGWSNEQLGIELRFRSAAGPEKLAIPVPDRAAPEMGETAKIVLKYDLPRVLYPGDIDLEIVFRISGSVDREKERTIAGEKTVIFFQLYPAWTSSYLSPAGIERKFGSGVRDLGRATFLGPGDEIELNLEPGEAAAGVGIVSYIHRGSAIPQGVLIGWLSGETENREKFAFPLVAGRNTAEVWWESLLPGQRQHRKAPIFQSWPVRSGGRSFLAYEYRTAFFFPRPAALRLLRLKNLTRRSGIRIEDIILIPPRPDDITEMEK